MLREARTVVPRIAPEVTASVGASGRVLARSLGMLGDRLLGAGPEPGRTAGTRAAGPQVPAM